MEAIEFQKVNKSTPLADDLLNFVENFSWYEVKDHTIRVIKNSLTEIFPWISTLFVSEGYRGNRISGKLIDFANQYAKDIGFSRTYIPTEYIGLYEKYGYCYVKDIVNYGNGIDRLYVKELD